MADLDFTLEPLSSDEVAVVCRMMANCEWTWHVWPERRLLHLSETLDVALAHARWHKANPDETADGETEAELYMVAVSDDD